MKRVMRKIQDDEKLFSKYREILNEYFYRDITERMPDGVKPENKIIIHWPEGKVDLQFVAVEIGITDISSLAILSLKKVITGSKDYEEEDIRELLSVAKERREEIYRRQKKEEEKKWKDRSEEKDFQQTPSQETEDVPLSKEIRQNLPQQESNSKNRKCYRKIFHPVERGASKRAEIRRLRFNSGEIVTVYATKTKQTINEHSNSLGVTG
ncbi:hypothetical protein NPIL_447671 [Nephila pilipes]|uniref:Uncharacterized protein n=1 Tax=Nephila pilipes TaxID=299642 RepID=A0A8X6TDQ7_NEPPI|nr:hypothetical protein NPIL_447671 [Nephila pilipes]